MKKEIKKKIINTSLASVIAVSAITPISIALAKNIKNSFYNDTSRVTSPQLLNETSINLSTAPDVVTNDSFISFPNGTISVISFTGLMAFDNSGNILWKISNPIPNRRIKAIEYNSKFQCLVVVFSNDKLGAAEPILEVQVYENVLTSNPTLKWQSGIQTIQDRVFFNSWGISPVYNENGAVDEYMIYNKYSKGFQLQWIEGFYRFKLSDNGVSMSPSINRTPLKFPEQSDGRTYFGRIVIYSIASFKYGNDIYSVISYAEHHKDENSGSKIQFALYKNFSFEKNINTGIYTNTLDSKLPNDYFDRMTDAFPSSVGFRYDSYNKRLILFFLHIFKGEMTGSWTPYSLYNDAALIRVDVDLYYGVANMFDEWVVYPFWNKAKDTQQTHNADRIVKTGQFQNAVIESKGFSQGYSSLLVSGYKTSLSQDKRKMIALIDLSKLGNGIPEGSNKNFVSDELVVNDNTPTKTEKMRLFKMGYNWDASYSDAKTYTDPSHSWNSSSGFALSEAFRFGFATLQYDIENSDPFDNNVIYSKAGMSRFSIFSPLIAPDSVATYGYETKVGNISSPFNWGDNNYRIDEVNNQYLNTYLETAKGPIYSKYLKSLSFIDLPSQAKLFVGVDGTSSSNPDSQAKDLLDVSLYSSFFYDAQGRIIRNNNLTEENLEIKYKIASFKISGFLPVTSEIPKQIKIDQGIVNSFVKSNPLSGNTKYLKIDDSKEQNFVNSILNFGDNKIPVTGHPAPSLKVEYSIGNKEIWLPKNDFIDYLSRSTEDVGTNKILFRLAIDSPPIEDSQPVYTISNSSFELHKHNPTSTADVLIYIHGSDFESQASMVKVSGPNRDISYDYGSLPVNPQNGEWEGVAGLKIQWTIDETAQYSDNVNDLSKWSNEQIKSIDGVKRYLAIRVISEPGYVYGPAFSSDSPQVIPTATKHIVDTTGVKSSVEVDLNILKQLVFFGKSHNLDIQKLKASEEEIIRGIHNGQFVDKFHINYQIHYFDKTKSEWLNSDQLIDTLKKYSTNYSNQTQGIIKFVNNKEVNVEGMRIFATIVSSDPLYDPFDSVLNIREGIEPNTDNVVTEINIKEWTKKLNSIPVVLKEGSTQDSIKGFTPPGMESAGSVGQGFLFGMSYQEIVDLFFKMGITPEFQAPGSSATDQKWVPIDQIINLNKQNELYIRFKVIDENEYSKIEFITNEDGIPQNNQNPTPIRLIVDLPVVIAVNLDDLIPLKLTGNTWIISNISDIAKLETEIIRQTKENNKTEDPITSDLIEKANIDIYYSLDELPINIETGNVDENSGKVWMSLEELNQTLLKSKYNFNTNRVFAKFVILENSDNKYQLSTSEKKEINSLDQTPNAPFKMYIHETPEIVETFIRGHLLLEGSQTSYQITNLTTWLETIPKGLVVEYNSLVELDSLGNVIPKNDGWSTNYKANQISVYKKYWIRFVVRDGYVFEKPSPENPKYSNPIELDATKLKAVIELKNEWLPLIELSGNTKNLNIQNEQPAYTQAIIPVKDLIMIEYTVDGVAWLKKDEFIRHLASLNGALNETKWIILRSDIKARWVINKEVNEIQDAPYDLYVDNIKINDDNSNNHGTNIITNDKNTSVRGYINIDKFTLFNSNNFKVQGTNSNAVLLTTNADKFNEMLNHYLDSNIFSILYSSTNPDNFLPENKVWNPETGGISPSLKLTGDFSNRHFAISFKITSEKYDMYDNNGGRIEQNEKILDKIPVIISIEINNPLVNQQVSINFLRNDMPVYYQNQGAFDFVINSMDFNKFIETLKGAEWTDEAKQSLELVYYVSKNKLSAEEEAEAHKKITEYSTSSEKYDVWKNLPIATMENPILDLKLSVGDHVIVALRIKKEFTPDIHEFGGYILKNNNHNPTPQERAYGFKVHADELQVNWQSLKLRNIGKAEYSQYGLDGYAKLKSLELVPHPNGDHLNVELDLNYFNDFHENIEGNVLISTMDEVLVKRQKSLPGYSYIDVYKDKDGKEIRDKDNSLIEIWKNSDGLLSPPEEKTNPTRTVRLSQSRENFFTMDNEFLSDIKHSFFRNQKIEIVFNDKKGEAPGNYNDYYVDNKDIGREYTFKEEIKFQVSNPNNIQYIFNSSEFVEFIKNQENIDNGSVYVNSIDPDKKAVNGSAKLTHPFSVTKIYNNDKNVLNGVEEIKNDIKTNFGDQVVLKTTYTPISGDSQVISGEDIYTIDTLRNGDKFKVEIASNLNDFIFVQEPAPLVFVISGLYETPIGPEKLQFLRVQQNGEINGQGTFSIFVNDPKYGDLDLDIESQLDGYKFLVRVWDGNKQIKHPWTSDFSLINNLSNGDKVEWKLVAKNNSPLEESYYNTIANINKHNVIDKVYSFSIVDKIGFANQDLRPPQEGIGVNPSNPEAYPEASGFTISGLKEKTDDKFTTITSDEFERVMKLMDFDYTGINGKGDMVSDQDVSQVVVSTLNPTTKQQFTLKDLLDRGYINFYSNNSTSSNLNNFDWNQVKDSSGNWLTSPGNLSNGDTVTIHYQDETMASPYIFEAPVVSGLENKSDEMSMIAWVGVGAASIATLGIFAIIYFIARNKKLK